MRFYTILLVASALVFSGCATSQVLTQNKEAAHRLAVLFRAWDNTSSEWFYPPTLKDLSKQLAASGFQDQLPQCKCKGGQMRDFVYVPGFTSTDGDWAFLFSPPQMAGDMAIVVHFDTGTKLMSRDEARKELEKSLAFTKDRQR